MPRGIQLSDKQIRSRWSNFEILSIKRIKHFNPRRTDLKLQIKCCGGSPNCRKIFWTHGNLHSLKTGKCRNCSHFKGGCVTRYGYRIMRIGRRMVFEHVFVMERLLGRRINWRKESVHHKNGDRLDNRKMNLELWASKNHGRHSRVSDLRAYLMTVPASLGGLKGFNRSKINNLQRVTKSA